MTQMHIIQAQEPKDIMDQWMNHYSSWTALKRSVAWFLKLKDLLKELKEKRNDLKELGGESKIIDFKKALKGKNQTCDDLVEAETEVVKYCWKREFQRGFGYAGGTL